MTMLDEPGMPDQDDLTPEAIDPDAPYGRRPDGTPYKKSPEHRAKLAAQLAQNNMRRAQAAQPAKPTRGPGRPPKAASSGTDYRPALQGLFQVVAFGVGQAGRLDPAFGYDAIAIQLHTPAIAEALNTTAQQDERLAAVLDSVASFGPYGLVLNALIPLVMQIGANHKLLAPNPDMGILAPQQLLAAAGVHLPAEDADPGMLVPE